MLVELNKNSSIENINHKANILIHPFYSTDTTPKKNKRFVTKTYLSNLNTFIEKSINSKYPLIIFQEEKRTGQLELKLRRYKDETIYLVKTKHGEATPVYKEDWETFVDILNSSGINLVEISGLYLVNLSEEDTLKEYESKYDKDGILLEFIDKKPLYIQKYKTAGTWLIKPFIPQGCMGYAIMNLLKFGIDVKISHQTAPCSGYEILKED